MPVTTTRADRVTYVTVTDPKRSLTESPTGTVAVCTCLTLSPAEGDPTLAAATLRHHHNQIHHNPNGTRTP